MKHSWSVEESNAESGSKMDQSWILLFGPATLLRLDLFTGFVRDFTCWFRTLVMSKIVLFVTDSNGSKPLIIVRKSSTLDIAEVLDSLPLNVKLLHMF